MGKKLHFIAFTNEHKQYTNNNTNNSKNTGVTNNKKGFG